MKIIAFGHRKRVGKDSATRFAISYIRQHHPRINVQIISFADIIKQVAYTMYSWGDLEEAIYYENHPDYIEQLLPKIGRTPRQIWDEVGLMGRRICPRTWIELALYEMDADLLICKDLRSVDEVEAFDAFGAKKIRIDRPDAPKGGPVDELLADFSGWDKYILNNQTLKELNQEIKKVCESAIKEWFSNGVEKE